MNPYTLEDITWALRNEPRLQEVETRTPSDFDLAEHARAEKLIEDLLSNRFVQWEGRAPYAAPLAEATSVKYLETFEEWLDRVLGPVEADDDE